MVSTAKVSGVPRVQTVPPWVERSAAELAWLEHALVWIYVKRGRSPEVHGAQCALAWVGGVSTSAPATADRTAPTRWRAMGELIVCGAVSNGDPYPEPPWWREAGIAKLETAGRRAWWEQWSTHGWTRAIAGGAGRALSWAMGLEEDTPPVLPRHLEDGSPVTEAARRECAAIMQEALTRPLRHRPVATDRTAHASASAST